MDDTIIPIDDDVAMRMGNLKISLEDALTGDPITLSAVREMQDEIDALRADLMHAVEAAS